MAGRSFLQRRPSAAPAPGGLLIQSDSAFATGKDLLNFSPYAEALAFLLDQKQSKTPLIVAISAPWGAGKTTLARLIEEQLQTRFEWDKDHIICWFNAWNHDDSPNLGAAFAARVAQSANGQRRWWRRLVQPLPSAMLTPEQRWRRNLWIILTSLTIAIALVLGPDTRNMVVAAAKPTDKTWLDAVHGIQGFGLTILVLLGAIAFIYPKVLSGTQALSRFINDPQSAAAGGSIESVRQQLRDLIDQATRGRRRFIVFVDDLERCRPPRAVEVCEVASQLLDHEGVVTVLVADMMVIARSAAIKYKALEQPDPDSDPGQAYDEYGRAYLQKLVQVQFDLPPATSDQLMKMLQISQATGTSTSDTSDGGCPASEVPVTRGPVQVDESADETGTAGLAAEPAALAAADQAADEPESSVARPATLAVALAGGPAGPQHDPDPPGADQPPDPSPGKSGDLIASIIFTVLCPALAAFLIVSFLNTGTVLTKVVYVVVLVFLTLLFIGCVMTVAEAGQKARSGRKRKELETAVQGQRAGTTIDQAVERISEESSKFDETSIRRQYFSVVLEDQEESGLRNSIDLFIAEFLPERPRAAKRLLNQVRLMMPIAIARGLFALHQGQASELSAYRFAKWLVLRQLWPRVALAAQADEEMIPQLEKAAREKSEEKQETAWNRALSDYKIADIDHNESLKRLLSFEPGLGEINELTFVTGLPKSVATP